MMVVVLRKPGRKQADAEESGVKRKGNRKRMQQNVEANV